MKYKYELRIPNVFPLLQTIQESFSLTTVGNLINEKVCHSQNEETSIPEAIQQTYTNLWRELDAGHVNIMQWSFGFESR